MYDCRGDAYQSAQGAAEAVERAKREHGGAFFLVETPYVYRCVDGHFHVDLKWHTRW